jgi:hypothetical protein
MPSIPVALADLDYPLYKPFDNTFFVVALWPIDSSNRLFVRQGVNKGLNLKCRFLWVFEISTGYYGDDDSRFTE